MSWWRLKRIIYIPFDHLNRDYGALKEADPASDVIAMVESSRMTTGKHWHPERLFFMISAARHFAHELTQAGFLVEYRKAPTTLDGLAEIAGKYSNLPIVSAEPSSYRQYQSLQKHGVEFVENDFFLTPRKLFLQWADSQNSYLMENFYRKQRVRLGLLMDGAEPAGGSWNYDKENRLPPPKNYIWPPYLLHERDELDQEVAQQLGRLPTSTWATTRTGALLQLHNFIDTHLNEFGPLEDAMTSENWALHHSLISPYLNVGLLHPFEVVSAVETAYRDKRVSIQSAEGFIRQVIGWREYVNGMYWFLGESYRENNALGATRTLLPLFENPEKTQMNCAKQIVSDINERAWVHHIPRLMVLSNLALITGTDPQEFLQWMREKFIDASDWVMVPNVIGMGVHADGGLMMSKPYAAGGAYISRMSNYCKPCVYNPKNRTGADACPFTTLYWDFLDRNKVNFSTNHRMAQQYFGLNRLSDIDEVRQRAQEVLDGLSHGVI